MICFTTGFVDDDPHNDRYGSSKIPEWVWHVVACFNEKNLNFKNIYDLKSRNQIIDDLNF